MYKKLKLFWKRISNKKLYKLLLHIENKLIVIENKLAMVEIITNKNNWNLNSFNHFVANKLFELCGFASFELGNFVAV